METIKVKNGFRIHATIGVTMDFPSKREPFVLLET
jgi:hypothetical protein